MKRVVLFLSLVAALSSCKDGKENVEETFTTGTTKIMIEESVLPLAEDIIQVFESYYDNASFEVVVDHEAGVMNGIFLDSVRLAIIPRDLTEKEIESLSKRVQSKVTPIAKEAIVFISNNNYNDSLIQYDQFIQDIQSTSNEKIYVFDNVNSSLVRKIKEDSGVKETMKNVFFLPSTKEVIEYIARNPKAVGIIGSNWIAQPDKTVEEFKKSIKTLAVLNASINKYIKPTQSTIADETYPLTRTINIIDVKGNSGLGKGLASFASGDKGQRLVLKSGLLPVTMPTREVIINQQ